jgi:hypothetical protein
MPGGKLAQFNSPEEGLQAIDNNLKSYGAKGVNTLSGVINKWAPPTDANGKPINDTNAYIQHVAKVTGLSPDQPIDLNNPLVRQQISAGIVQHENGTQALYKTPAPVAPMSQAALPFPNPKNAAEIKANQEATARNVQNQQEVAKKAAETGITTAAKSEETERQKAGEFISKIQAEADHSDETVRKANQIINHATLHPDEFGWSKAGGATGFMVGTTSGIPIIGKAVESAIENAAGHDVAARRDATNANGKQLSLDFVAQNLAGTGARLGIGMEKLGQDVKALGTDHTAETNIISASLIKMASQKAKEQSAAWDAYKKVNPSASPFEFLQSPENMRIQANYNQKADALEGQLRRQFPSYFNDSTIPGSGSSSTKRPLSEFIKKPQ